MALNRRRAAVAATVLACSVVAAIMVVALDHRPVEVAARGVLRTTSTLRPSTTAAPTTGPEPSTTEAPATEAPAIEPPTTEPPATAAPPPPPTTGPAPAPGPAAAPPAPTLPPRGPITVLVVGDSTGFTASFPVPVPPERPPYIRRIDTAAVIGCGVLTASGYTPVDAAGEGAGGFGDCPSQPRREFAGLARRPTWMVMFSGGWEHLPWIPPGATEPLPAGSPQLRTAIRDHLIAKAAGARGVGTRTAFVAWSCPSGVAPTRTGDYARWYDQILREAAAAVPGAIVIEPTARVCVGGDPGGAATPEKDAAFEGGHHPKDRRWLWNEWLGPILWFSG